MMNYTEKKPDERESYYAHAWEDYYERLYWLWIVFFFLASMGNLCSAYTGAFIAKVKQKSKY